MYRSDHDSGPLQMQLSAHDIREIINGLDAVIWELDPETWRFTFVNQRAEVILGYPIAQWLNEPDFWSGRLVHPEDRAWTAEFCRSAVQEGRDHGFEYRVVAADGRVLWLRDAVRVVRDPQGRARLHGIMFDITDQKRAEADLRESEERFRALVDNVSDVIAVIDASHEFHYVNPSTEKLLGYPADQLHHRSILDFVVSEDVELVEQQLNRRFGGEDSNDQAVEFRLWHQDGSVRVLEVRARRHELEPGVPAIVLAGRDVTAHKRSELELRRQRAHFARLFENSPEAIVLLDEHDRVLHVNQEFSRLFGYTLDEVAGREINELVVPPELHSEASALSLQAASGQRIGIDTVRRTKDGRLVAVSIVAVTVESEDGGPQVYGIYRDETARKRAEQALEKSEEQLRSLLEGVRAIVWECEAATWKFTYISHGVEEILGYSASQWYEDDSFWEQTIHPHDRNWVVQACVAGMKSGRDSTLEYRALAQDGRIVWLRDVIRVVTDENGQPQRLCGVMIDITEEKNLEEQFRQAQKMEAVGRLAGGVAHDFNNVMTAIQGHAELLLDDLHGADPHREHVAELLHSAERATGLTRQLLAFSRKQILRPEPVDLNAVITRLEKMLRRIIGEEILFEAQLAPDLGRVLADPGQIEQVLMNLMVNARDAMPAGGRLVITTRNADLDQHHATQFSSPIRPGPYAVIAVQDTGSGMNQQTRERIFEPFFTTKEPGKGTGLGLSTAYGIIKQSGGYIQAQSEEGAGSTFEVYLPLLEAADLSPVAEMEVALKHAPAGTETVLVVEDETVVRSLICRVLRKHGYRVLEAADGVAALQVIASCPDSLHLVISDVVMPEMGGRELAEQLKLSHPELPFLFMSGYTEDELMRRGISDRRTLFLEKPFSPGALAAKVREILAAPAQYQRP